MTKKYELTDEYIIENGKKLYRIKACKTFMTKIGIVIKGELGGYVESVEELPDIPTVNSYAS